MLAPLVALVLLELALRAAGAGVLEPVFVPVANQSGYLQPNPALIQRYFPDPRQAPQVAVDTTWFPREKPANALRIFVQGESSAAGFPYGRWASPAAMLQQRLQHRHPDRAIEVINTAMAAVSSYVLLDIADEIVALRPDAIVIYTGHNEFLGVGGVGSSLASAQSPTLARMVMQLRHMRLYRALERGLSSLLAPSSPPAAGDGTLMSRVARERSIALDSPLYRRGIIQFDGNLERLLAKYRAAGIPVFIGTLASNDRDQPPFAGGDPSDPESASFAFRRAQALEASGELGTARAAYATARDRDALRFRAPSAINASIVRIAAREGATVVPVQAALERASTHGIVGADLMLEHVHPNVEGYFLLASVFDDALAGRFGAGRGIDAETARREIPVTEIDRLNGEYRVAVLRNDWPFVAESRPTSLPRPGNRTEEIAQAWFAGRTSWADAMNAALAEYQRQGNTAETARVAVNLADAFVTSDTAQYAAGRSLLRDGQAERSLRYLRRALALNGEPVEYSMSLAESLYRNDRREDSIEVLEAVLARHPGEPRATYWLRTLQEPASRVAPH